MRYLDITTEAAGDQADQLEAVMSREAAIRRIVALHAPGLRAEIRGKRALRYGNEPDSASGIASHVRAASAIRRQGSRLIVIQDDVNALAVIDASSCIMPLLLPPAADGRRSFDDTIGNKHLKMDLEAAVVLPDARVLAFGSGSARARERIVIVESETGVRVRRAPGLYARLRKHCEAVGTELNIEGAVIQGHRLRLFQRGNGAQVTGGRSGSLVFDVDLAQFLRWLAGRGPVPNVIDVLEVDLGSIDGVPFGFADAAVAVDGRIAFVACAEESVNVRGDGPVLGCRFGWLDDTGAQVTDVIESDGRATPLKLEGIEPRPGSIRVFDVVADMDRPDHPALLAELWVTGWPESSLTGL
jgi:hypothetical protein